MSGCCYIPALKMRWWGSTVWNMSMFIVDDRGVPCQCVSNLLTCPLCPPVHSALPLWAALEGVWVSWGCVTSDWVLKQQAWFLSKLWRLGVWDQGVDRVGFFWGPACSRPLPQLLLNPRSLCSLHNTRINPRDEILRQGIWLYSESQLTEKVAD